MLQMLTLSECQHANTINIKPLTHGIDSVSANLASLEERPVGRYSGVCGAVHVVSV